MDDVELEFEDKALELIVDKAIERKTGARGLRSIIEEIMRDIMFEIPSNPKIEKCIITKETVANGEAPKIIINNNKEVTKKSTSTKRVTTKNNATIAQKKIKSCFQGRRKKTRFYFLIIQNKSYVKHGDRFKSVTLVSLFLLDADANY